MYPSDQNLITTSSLFHFPSPYFPYEDDHVFFQNLHDLFTSTDINNSNNNMSTQTINNNMTDSTTSTLLDPQILKQATDQSSTKREPKKRSSKKDRHSKINTAQGPRDRRMRLSLDVARKFFNLQDILGFEKASKTVEWLLTQSKSTIEDLTRAIRGLNSNHSSSVGAANSVSSTTSECEVLSGTDEPRFQMAKPKGKGLSGAKGKKRKGIVRRVAFDSTAKELREKARERARERTTRKRKLQIGESNLSQLGCPSLAQNGSIEVEMAEVDEPSSRDERQADHDEQGSSRENDNLFVDSFWSSSTFFNYQHNSTTSHEFAEFHGYNN